MKTASDSRWSGSAGTISIEALEDGEMHGSISNTTDSSDHVVVWGQESLKANADWTTALRSVSCNAVVRP